MNFAKKTLFWLFVLIALAGAFLFFDRGQETARQAKEAELRLFPFAVREVSEFWIDRDGERIRAQREPDGWQLTQPLQTRGDAKAIEKLLGNIVGARKDALLFAQAEPSKLAELGFDSRPVEMGLRAGGAEVVLVFGQHGPTHNVGYVMFKGRPEVYRVHADLRKEASRDAFALRDKTLLEFDPVALRRLEIARKGAPRVVVEHDQGKWNLLEPARGRASMTKVLELLYGIRNGEIKAFAAEKPAGLKPYGLASPMLEVTIHQAKKDAPLVLSVGDRDRAQRGYFARTNQSERVFDVEEELVNAILLGMDKLAESDATK